jgi:hypothetical protein
VAGIRNFLVSRSMSASVSLWLLGISGGGSHEYGLYQLSSSNCRHDKGRPCDDGKTAKVDPDQLLQCTNFTIMQSVNDGR